METNEVAIRVAQPHDVAILASMNLQLIQDENSPNPMNLAELEDRMRRFLSTDWEGILFQSDGAEIGYALIQHRNGQRPDADHTLFIRQFFIRRDRRRRGLGRAAIHALMQRYCHEDSVVELGVLEVNSEGRRFWEALGFQPAYTTMRKRIR